MLNQTTKTTITALLIATTLASASPTPILPNNNLKPRYELGGINVDRACQSQNGVGWTAVRLGDSVNDWRCRRGEEWRSVNMSAACAVQYGWPDAYARPGRGANDWVCHLDV